MSAIDTITKELLAKIERGLTSPFLPYAELKNVLDRPAVETILTYRTLGWNLWRKREHIIVDVLGSRLGTLAAILVGPNRKETLQNLISWYIPSEPIGLKDAQLPHSRDDIQKHLPAAIVDVFYPDQLKFCAAVYREGENYDELVEYFVNHREPFIGEPVRIGDGHSGTVFAVTIAPGHFAKRHADPKAEAVRLAYKNFGGDHRQISSAAMDYVRENRVLEELGEADFTHDSLLYKQFSVVTRDTNGKVVTCRLFYELAACNLREALTGAYPHIIPSWASLEGRTQLIRQVRSLVEATMWLHIHKILHLDMKPDNVLYFSYDDKHVLKIADYGFSVKLPYPRKTSSTNGAMWPSECQGPEVSDPKTDRVGWWTDDWSLGCIIVYVLAYMDNGHIGVETLKNAKQDDRIDSTYDTFFEEQNTTSESVKLVSGVRNYCQKLAKNARERDAREGDIIADLLDFLQRHVFVAAEVRRNMVNKETGLHKKMQEVMEGYNALLATHSTFDGLPIANRRPEGTTETVLDDMSLTEIPSGIESDETCRGLTEVKKVSVDGRIFEQVIDRFNPDPSSPTSCAPLCKAVRSATNSSNSPKLSEDYRNTITELLKQGNLPSDCCSYVRHRTTPIHHVISRGNNDVLKLLIKDGIAVDLKKIDQIYNRTPLAFAGGDGKVETCRVLLDHMKSKGDCVSLTDFFPEDLTSVPNRKKIERLIQRQYQK